ncbi:MAG: hypothetical protein JXB85_05565 [Anaerolineales bacterium]|nr:hypothetical protein [Anaerolineales bacterium]
MRLTFYIFKLIVKMSNEFRYFILSRTYRPCDQSAATNAQEASLTPNKNGPQEGPGTPILKSLTQTAGKMPRKHSTVTFQARPSPPADNEPTTAIIVSAGDGFLGDLVPDFDLFLEDQLRRSGNLSSVHSERAYKNDVRRFNEWRAGRSPSRSSKSI